MADVDEKTKKARAERREKLLAWYEEKDLPPVIGDYELRIIDEQHDRIYYAFGWFHKSNGWKIRVLYDEETADYMVKMDLHMITLTEIECITGDLEEFKRLVKLLTPEEIDLSVRRVSRIVKISMFMDRYPAELSGGQQQRVVHGRAAFQSGCQTASGNAL